MRRLKSLKIEISSLQRYKWFSLLIKPYRVFRFFRFFARSVLNKEVSKQIDIYISSNLNRKGRLLIYCDIMLANIILGASTINYFTYNFYNMPFVKRREFITEGQSRRLLYAFNPPKYHAIFLDKYQTYNKFKDYYERKIIIAESTELELFKEFCIENRQIFIKPRNLSRGRGARKIQIDESINLESLYQECLDKQVIIEEVIDPHPDLAGFHPPSLNTMRITTVVTKNGVRLMKPAYFKMGKNDSVNDNWSDGGILAEVDIDTGIIHSCGIDKYLKQYAKHPNSNKQIIGYQIPYWEELKGLVRELALVVPQNRRVGWDITLNILNKPVLVEGNHYGDFFTVYGNRKLYEKTLKEI